MPQNTPDAVDIDAHLHLDAGIPAAERGLVVSRLSPLGDLLKSLDRSTLRIEAWVKNRGERGQIAYASIHAKDTDIVADDDSADVGDAFSKIQRDLKRQLADLHDRRTNRRY